MNAYLAVILAILLADHLLRFIVDLLNVSRCGTELPGELKGYYSPERYKASQLYLKENTYFSFLSDAFFLLLTVTFMLAGGFNLIDTWARRYFENEITLGLAFGAALFTGYYILRIPFSLYQTFVIEGKYGFNKTAPVTFVTDLIKGWLLTAVIGGSAFACAIWFFAAAGKPAWLYCWAGLTLFQVSLVFIAPVVIMPLFNKFTPLEEGGLKAAIADYARSQDFKLSGIFKMDGSRRSTKSNAFFTGFGRFRRVALFDTLIAKHTVDELVSVLAHEVGHYKKGHVIKGMIMSVAVTGVMLYILSFFINNRGLFDAFRMEHLSVYAGIFFFGFLYTPVQFVFSVAANCLSRRHEYEADEFAAMTYKKPEAMISALKKLSVDNLSNLTPHPLKVFLEYSHPPVLKRISAIKNM